MAPTAWHYHRGTTWIRTVYPEDCNSNIHKSWAGCALSLLFSFHQLHNTFQIRATHQTTTIQKTAKTPANFLHPNKFCLCTPFILLPKMRCLLACFHFKQTAAATKCNQPKESVYKVLTVVSRGEKTEWKNKNQPTVLHRHHCIHEWGVPSPTKERLSYLLVSKAGLPQQQTPAVSHLKLSPVDIFLLFHKTKQKSTPQTSHNFIL